MLFGVMETSRSPICYGSKMCLKLGHISAALYMIRRFVAGLQISRRGKCKELHAKLARSSGKHDDGCNFAPSWREVNDHICQNMYSRNRTKGTNIYLSLHARYHTLFHLKSVAFLQQKHCVQMHQCIKRVIALVFRKILVYSNR